MSLRLILPMILIACLLAPSTVLCKTHRLAVVIGNNASVEEDLDPLRFADDDAFKYARFFHFVADSVSLLTRADEDSEALYGGRDSLPPTRDNVLAALDNVVEEASRLGSNGDEVVVYFLFSGHGNYDAEGRGFLHLEDGRLTTRDLFYHLIGHSKDFYLVLLIDACNASFLVKSRGGSDRRPAGPPTLELEKYENVGLVLSSSSIGEVKEWGRILAGIFSHQVRSALAGVADVDGDGAITFQELASFVESANRDIDNPALKLTPYIRPPLARPNLPLIDVSETRFPSRLALQFDRATRVSVYDQDMLRYADFHLSQGYGTHLALAGDGPFTVQVSEKKEYVVPAGAVGVVDLKGLEKRQSSELASRGVDQYYVKHLYSSPYGAAFAADYLGKDYEPGLVFVREYARPSYESRWAWASVGVGVALLGTTGLFGVLAGDEEEAANATPWADEKAAHNDRISLYNNLTWASAVVGGAAVLAGAALFIFDRPTKSYTVAPRVGPGIKLIPTGGGALLEGRF